MRKSSQDLGFQQRADAAASLSQSSRRLGAAETRPSRSARPREDLNGLAVWLSATSARQQRQMARAPFRG